jgi:hypothetical protein
MSYGNPNESTEEFTRRTGGNLRKLRSRVRYDVDNFRVELQPGTYTMFDILKLAENLEKKSEKVKNTCGAVVEFKIGG